MIAYQIDVNVRAKLGDKTITFIVGSVECIGQVLKDVDNQSALTNINEATITRIEI